MKYLLLLTSFLFADVAIEPFVKTYHWDRDEGYNENHEYLAITYRHEQWDFSVATYINSRENRSNDAYVGYRHIMYDEDVKLGLFGAVGYRSGYTRHLGVYAGLYGEYKDVYVKWAINTKLTAITVGYIIREF